MRKKAKRQKDREEKKVKMLNGEDLNNETRDPDTPIKLSESVENEIEEDSDDDSSFSNEDLKDTKNPDKNTKKELNHQPGDDAELSSMTTRKNKTERNHYILRMAIDEKYIPSSIYNLRYAAYAVFFILLILAGKNQMDFNLII